MTEWEYYAAWNGENGTDTGEWGWNIKEASEGNWGPVQVMNHLGARGWEMVSVHDYRNGTVIYFKRPKA